MHPNDQMILNISMSRESVPLMISVTDDEYLRKSNQQLQH